jgi:transcriptional regulator with XRE-family HTH domain
MTNEEKQQTRDRIGQRIAALRKAAGLTQEELAIRAQLQRTHIGRIEAGRYAVTLETVQAIAQALGMTVDIIDPRLEGLAKLPTKQPMAKKTFEQECAEGRWEFDPNRSFEERCEIVRRTAITSDMTYEERLAMQKARYGL